MTEAAALVFTLRSRGIELVAAGERVRFRPATAVTPTEREGLRQHKHEILGLLRSQRRLYVELDPDTVRDFFGEEPDPHEVACLRFDVLSAVAALEREMRAGWILSGPRHVRGHPLANWLQLHEVARLLLVWRDRRAETRDGRT